MIMQSIALDEAQNHLGEIIEKLTPGEEVGMHEHGRL
jgi:antitoxin (DNA-binding transcriptional repressor) of toxin-antitoxin stability system